MTTTGTDRIPATPTPAHFARGIAAPAPCTDHPGCTVYDVRAVKVETIGTRIRIRGHNAAGVIVTRTKPYDHGARDPWADAVADHVATTTGRPRSAVDVIRGDDAGRVHGRTVRRYAAHVR